MNEEEFYIGWQDKAGVSYKSIRKKFFIFCCMLLVLFSALYLFVEKNFISSYFDYGNFTELKGTVVEYPVFGLKTVIDDQQVTVPLVGFGKFDANPVLSSLKQQIGGQDLSGYTITLKGTIIQYKNKRWMELTEGDNSIISVDKSIPITQEIVDIGQRTVNGEIVDPKCFFGVMNPAYGKIHKSCAIRCISGGIPPILAVKEGDEYIDYYFLTDQEGFKVNKEVLSVVGEPVRISGYAQSVDDWKVLKIDKEVLKSSIQTILDDQFAICQVVQE